MDFKITSEQFEAIVKHLQIIKDQSRLIGLHRFKSGTDSKHIITVQAQDIEQQVKGIFNLLCDVRDNTIIVDAIGRSATDES